MPVKAKSEPVAAAMAEGALKRTGADYACSTTGYAGPGKGTEEAPVGTVFVGLAFRQTRPRNEAALWLGPRSHPHPRRAKPPSTSYAESFFPSNFR